jgi:hypothetical protein
VVGVWQLAFQVQLHLCPIMFALPVTFRTSVLVY